MGKLVITEFITLDGVIDSPGGEHGYKHTGWSFELDRGDAGNQFKVDETMASEALLLGRVTYEGFAAAWPERDGEFADKFNSMPKYVVSSTLTDPEWTNTRVLPGDDLAAAVARVKDEVGGDVVVHGSGTLVQGLLEAGLVDELRLMLYPMVLGSGKRLWGETTDKHVFALKRTETVGDGITILIYERTA
jgi:dihydrofolate reductase